MRITALGHAGLHVETAAATLLIDPWLSPEGAFQASWFQYPENAHLMQPALLRSTAIAISHEHLDHLDPWFLAQVPSGVPVVIPRYPSAALRAKVLRAGARPVIEVAPWEVYEVARGMRLFFVAEPSPMNHDAAVVVCAGGRTLLDLNDARLTPMQLRGIRQEAGGRVDALAFQGAGASWYPMAYDYPAARRAELSRHKRIAKLRYAGRAIAVVEPDVALPFGGPPCFLSDDLFHLNDEMEGGIFPDQEEVAAWLAAEGLPPPVVLRPGDAWDVERRAKDADDRWHGFGPGDRRPYLRAYAERRRAAIAKVLARHPDPTTSLWPAFASYFMRLLDLSPYFAERVGMRVGFDVTGPGGGAWAVDARPGREAISPTMGDCQYTYRIASRWMAGLLGGETAWEDFLLSARFSARREPDLYNDHLLGLLKFADAGALAAVEAWERSGVGNERITVRSEGRTYSIGRYCPHAGNDLLETGEVLPGGVLRCLAHHYEFDLASGTCLTGRCAPLDVAEEGGSGRRECG